MSHPFHEIYTFSENDVLQHKWLITVLTHHFFNLFVKWMKFDIST